MSEVVCEQGLSPLESDIPDRWSIAEYRKAMAIAATTAPERASRFRRLRALRGSPEAGSTD